MINIQDEKKMPNMKIKRGSRGYMNKENGDDNLHDKINNWKKSLANT